MTEIKKTIATNFKETIEMLESFRTEENSTAIDEKIAFLTDRMEKAQKKNGGEKKPSVASIENPKLAEELYEIMESGIKYTATQISTLGIEKIGSSSKATTILKILCADGRVANVKEKGASLYYKV